MREFWRSLLRKLRSLRPQEPPPPAPIPQPPAPRMCEWCSGPLPEEAPPNQRYCKPLHAEKARQRRSRDAQRSNARAKAVENAWSLDATPGMHRASCGRKRAYGTFGDALTAIRWLRDDGRGTEQCRAYKCLACGNWHITSALFSEKDPGVRSGTSSSESGPGDDL
jgi:hypothetical protein